MNDTLSIVKEKEVLWEENHSIEPQHKSESKTVSEATSSMPITENDSVRSECKNTGKISGIYKIVNKVNGKYYVGSASNIQKGYTSRWSKHKCYLRNNKHPNQHLQNAWNKYGEKAFDFIIVKEVSVGNLMMEEQVYLDHAEKDQLNTYNLCFTADRPNRLCDASKKSQIEKLKLHYSNPLIKAEISRRSKGKHLSEEHKNILRDQTIYSFQNIISGEIFKGRRCDFIRKYSMDSRDISNLIRRTQKSVRKWILSPQQ